MRKLLLFVRSALWLLTGALAGCAGFGGSRMPSGPINVVEVHRSNVCGTQGDAPQITLFKDETELQAWETARNVDFFGGPIRHGAYALVELGARDTGGYGILISRRAKLRDGLLRLTATFLTPPAGQPIAPSIVSPCVLVALPRLELNGLVLLDPGGKERARTYPPTPVAPAPVPTLDVPEVPAAAALPGVPSSSAPPELPVAPAPNAPPDTTPPPTSPRPEAPVNSKPPSPQ